MLYAEQLHRELLAAQASCIVTWHCFLVHDRVGFLFLELFNDVRAPCAAVGDRLLCTYTTCVID